MEDKRKWLEQLPQKYKLSSNDKIDALVNGEATNKVYFGPRQMGKTHMLLLDAIHYIKNNGDRRVAMIAPNHMQMTMNYDKFAEMVRDLIDEEEIRRITRNPCIVELNNGTQVIFQYNSLNMRGHRFDAVYLDNLDYVNDNLFDYTFACTTHSDNAFFIANQTSTQDLDKAMIILRRNR